MACFYIDNMGYQENILPKYHAEKHDVFILTSDFSFDATGKRCKKEKKEYINEYGIPVKVLERKAKGGKYNDFENLYSTLCDISPDVIFCHGGQFVALRDVIKYCKENKEVKLFIDQHGDYYNTPVNTFKRRMGQYFIYGRWMRKAVKYTERFWGVTPWRCEYLNDVYKIPKEKIELLPNEEKTVEFEITKDTLAFVGADLKRKAEKGRFRIFIGKDSEIASFGEFELI